MKKYNLVLLIFLLISCYVQAQTTDLDDKAYEKDFLMSVKGAEEFMARFNGEERHPALSKDTNNLKYRELASLLNMQQKELLKNFKPFADSIIANNVLLHFEDTSWYAEAHCKVKYKGKENNIVLFLQTERIKDVEYKWVLVGAKGSILGLNKTKNPGMILPTDNELNFMEFQDIFKRNAKSMIKYAKKDYETDGLSAFFALMSAGVLDFEYVEDITYYFTNVPGYIFKINRFDREGINSGWLISSYEQCKDKVLYIKNLMSNK
jgi:hypothetical protein